ncbi:MAG: PcfJ domain-containing protein [Ruminiclostridium sp.]|nr:PcfJ domain-containing protein [Ruminiclostridium sp.]
MSQIPEYLVEDAVERYCRKFYFVYPNREMTETDYLTGSEPTGKRTKGYTGVCTACGESSQFDGFVPGKAEKAHLTYNVTHDGKRVSVKYTACPCCGETVEIMKGWYGKKHLRDRFYLQSWEVPEFGRVILHEAIIFLDNWDEWREYNGAKKTTIYDLRTTTLTPGKSVSVRWNGVQLRKSGTAPMYEKCGRSINPWGAPISIDWEAPRAVYHDIDVLRDSYLHGIFEYLDQQIREESLLIDDLADWIIRLNEEPVTEFAAKAGFSRLALERVSKTGYSHGTRHIDFSAKSPKKMWRGLSRNNARQKMIELMKLVDPADVSTAGLEMAADRFIHTADKPETLAPIVSQDYIGIIIIKQILGYLPAFPAQRIISYIREQSPQATERCSIDRSRYYRDYLAACAAIGAPLNEARTAFPENLTEAHDDAVRKKKYTFSEETAAKCEKRRAALLRAGYEYEHGGIVAVIPAAPGEITAEGENLDHCVGGYAQLHCDGETNIIFIRRKGSAASWFTLEVDPKTRKFVQCYGYKNQTSGIFGNVRKYDPEVGKFLYHYRRRLTWAAAHKKQIRKQEDKKCRKTA